MRVVVTQVLPLPKAFKVFKAAPGIATEREKNTYRSHDGKANRPAQQLQLANRSIFFRTHQVAYDTVQQTTGDIEVTTSKPKFNHKRAI
jgi:hypothetical protein